MHKILFSRFVRWVGYDLGISPNQITLGRLVFFFPGWLFWIYRYDLAATTGTPWQLWGWLASFIVTVVIIFDIVDGALARETNQVSDQGKILDPIVDKLITYSTLVLFWPSIHKSGLAILFSLDVASTFLRGAQVEGANLFGKRKAFAQNLSKLFFAMAILCSWPWLSHIGNFLIWAAVVLATISVSIRLLPNKVKTTIQVAIPQFLTLGNLAGGFFTIWCAYQGKVGLGATINFVAMLCDLFDGAVARKLGVSSRFGGQFDTIADMVSFGCAPAALVISINDASPLSCLLGTIYFAATLFRLYDYGRSKNITPKGFFRGMPSPAGAWLVVASIFFAQPWLSLATLVAASLLMCSFRINWIHFNKILTTMTLTEMLSCIGLGSIFAFLATPAAFSAGPIIVYMFSPGWRKPPISANLSGTSQ
nr:CDP-alcohol phosphatidyltransferase family protein [Desulfobulbaceae bacterium]